MLRGADFFLDAHFENIDRQRGDVGDGRCQAEWHKSLERLFGGVFDVKGAGGTKPMGGG
jgi:hypothetical protein